MLGDLNSRCVHVLAGLAIACLPLLAPSKSVAAEIHVYPGESIQTAISDALNGDVIIVHEGTYSEHINLLGKAITLRSTEPADPDVVANTIIDGGNAGTIVTCENGEGPETVLNGFTITNGSEDFGGAMANFYCSPTVTNCTFSDNSAVYGGGIFNYGSAPALSGCIFTGNSAVYDGAGIYNYFSDATVSNCTFTGNTAVASGGGIWNSNNTTTITGCTFTGNLAGWGGGMCNDACSAAIETCAFTDNSADVGGGMVNRDRGNSTVVNCTFTSNSADVGGGMGNRDGGNPTVVNCTFVGNTALDVGGGMDNDADDDDEEYSPTVVNCLFTSNAAGDGGGMHNRSNNESSDYSPAVINCTFTNNVADYGGAMENYLSSPIVTNCILWGDTSDEIHKTGPASPIVTYCNVQGGYEGEGNIDVDPLFVDAGSGDLRLEPGSPCIDAGNSSAVPPDITVDLDGNPRFIDDPNTPDTGIGSPCVDMGAYEFSVIIFDPPVEVATIGEPTDIKSADFDGADGNDIAITQLGEPPEENGKLVLLLNDGSGLQYDEQFTEVGHEPSALAVADFDPTNGNGPDAAVCNAGDDNVMILLNAGDGTFVLPPDIVGVGSNPSAITAGHFNNDGFLDLAVANRDDDTVTILTNDGAGAFSEWLMLSVGDAPSALAAADFNGDDLIDLAVANEGDDNVMIFLNTGARGFELHATIPVGLDPGVLEPEDLDDDEDIDMVVGDCGTDTIHLLLNNGQAGFQTTTLTIGQTPASIDFGDLDADGDQDIIVVADTPDSRAVRVLRNDLIQTSVLGFTHVSDLAPDPNLRLTATEDLNDDDLPDIIAVDAPPEGGAKRGGKQDDGAVNVLLNAAPPAPACPADFDGDGDVDTADLLHLLGCWGTPCGDVDGDGDTDTADLLALLGAWGECP